MAIGILQKTEIDGVKYNTVKFGEINFGELGYVVQSSPQYEYAEHEVEKTRIPGRNGEHIHYTGAYLNTNRQYSLVKKLSANNDFRDHSEYVSEANSLIQQLKSLFGYQILQDSFEPNYYRYAIYTDGSVVSNGNDQVVAITLIFELMPQRWLIDGNSDAKGQIVENNLTNPTKFDALPKITITAKANQYAEANPQPTSETFEKYKYYTKDDDIYTLASEYIEDTIYYVGSEFESETTLTINSQEITIKWLESMNVRTIIIDSEMQDCYDINGNNLNGLVGYMAEFPKLKPGANTIEIQNGTIGELIPRWWTI